jgi:hypothetical protein
MGCYFLVAILAIVPLSLIHRLWFYLVCGSNLSEYIFLQPALSTGCAAALTQAFDHHQKRLHNLKK